MNSDEPYISLRLTAIDTVPLVVADFPRDQEGTTIPHTFSKSPFFKSTTDISRVPEIRIWGATAQGQRCCLHVHGALPYLYIEYTGSLNPEDAQKYIRIFGQRLNLAFFHSWNRKSNYDSRKHQFVGFITLCKGIPFYGFHVGYRYFLKIHALDPKYMHRLAEILRSGICMPSAKSDIRNGPNPVTNSIVNSSVQVFEAHIPFILQFMLDMNLYGCNWIHLKRCCFRSPLPQRVESDVNENDLSQQQHRIYDETNVPASWIFDNFVDRVSPGSKLEFDCHISDILNRHAVAERQMHNDFTELLKHPIPDNFKLVYSVKGVWEDERQRRKDRGEDDPYEDDDNPADSASGERRYTAGQMPPWASSARYQEMLDQLLADDKAAYMKANGGHWPPKFETFVHSNPFEDQIPTTFQSVESLFKSTWERDEALGSESPFGVWSINGIGLNKLDVELTARDLSIDPEAIQNLADALDLREKRLKKGDANLPVPEDGLFDDHEGMEDNRFTNEDQFTAESQQRAQEEANEWNNEDEQAALFMAERQPNGQAHLANSAPAAAMSRDNSNESSESATSLTVQAFQPEVNGYSTHSTPEDSGLEEIINDQADNQIAICPNDEGDTYGWSGIRLQGDMSNSEGAFDDSQLLSSSQSTKPPSKAAYGRQHASSPHPPSRTNLFSTVTVSQARRLSPVPDPIISLKGLKRAHAYVQPVSPLMTANKRQRLDLSIPDQPVSPSPDDDDPGVVLDLVYSKGNMRRSSDADDDDLPPSPTLRVPSPAPLTPMFDDSIMADGDESAIANDSVLHLLNDDESQIALTSETASIDVTIRLWQIARPPPTAKMLLDDILTDSRFINGRYRTRATVAHQKPFYSNPRDVPLKDSEYGGTRFRIHGTGVKWLEEFQVHPQLCDRFVAPTLATSTGVWSTAWQWTGRPPSRGDCIHWLEQQESKDAKTKVTRNAATQALTQANPFGFKQTQIQASGSSDRLKEHMMTLCLELQATSSNGKLPDPDHDEIQALFYCLHSDSDNVETTTGAKPGCLLGCFLLVKPDTEIAFFIDKNGAWRERLGLSRFTVKLCSTEEDMIMEFGDEIVNWDPEVLAGFEIQNASWGYLFQRADILGLNLIADLSRVVRASTGKNAGKSDNWGYTQSSTIKITGRHVLPIWRLLKGDFALLQYSFSNVCFQILHKRVPHFSAQRLSSWWTSQSLPDLALVLQYWLERVELDFELLDEAEIVSHTTEFARIYGVDFASVINRGSQFKVESIMFRIAKPENYVLLSPTREEVGKQNALEAMPLIAEPQSAFYKDPVVVLDFQSLYPSCMIAYNYCYSTCLGRIETFKGTFKFGFVNLHLQVGLLSLLKNHINISPNGLIFVKPILRRSLLAKMLSELLSTRVMVKGSMKLIKQDKALTRVYNARQLGLKLLANVTYGYTSATFSGRMPCAEIADAIVQTGRESLEKARTLIHAQPTWAADVVYGDTDSLFIWLPGKTKEDAFRIGLDMATSISYTSPRPVKLKFEKVYLPCVLASKKRYVGFKYESMADKEPAFDAKGIETVRRDFFPILQKMLEACIKILFRTQDLSQVKAYCEMQWRKIYEGEISPQDFLFAREVKMGSYSPNGTPPPGAELARQRLAADPRDEVQYGERLAYLIPEAIGNQRRQNDRVRGPLDFLENGQLRVDASFYIGHTVNALNRIFTLLGVDVKTWHSGMRKTIRATGLDYMGAATQTQPTKKTAAKQAKGKLTLSAYFTSTTCSACKKAIDNALSEQKLCDECQSNPQRAAVAMLGDGHHTSTLYHDLQKVCASCAGASASQATQCESIDCPVLYKRFKVAADRSRALDIVSKMDKLLV